MTMEVIKAEGISDYDSIMMWLDGEKKQSIVDKLLDGCKHQKPTQIISKWQAPLRYTHAKRKFADLTWEVKCGHDKWFRSFIIIPKIESITELMKDVSTYKLNSQDRFLSEYLNVVVVSNTKGYEAVLSSQNVRLLKPGDMNDAIGIQKQKEDCKNV